MQLKYKENSSIFHKMDPLSKLIWLLCISILTIRYETATIQMYLLISVILVAVVLSKFTLKMVWYGVRIPIILGVPYFILQLIFIPGTDVIYELGYFKITSEALNFAIAITCRLIILLLSSFVFIVTTDPRDIVLALSQKLKVPYRFSFSISLALRFLPIIHEEAMFIRAAQRLRGFVRPKGIRLRIKAWKQFAIAVFVQAIQHVQQIAITMDTKAFGLYKDRTYIRTIRLSIYSILFSAFIIVTTITLLITINE